MSIQYPGSEACDRPSKGIKTILNILKSPSFQLLSNQPLPLSFQPYTPYLNKMFSKLAVVATIAFAAIAAAVPTGYIYILCHLHSYYPLTCFARSGQCQTSDQYCCNSVQNAGSPQATAILGDLLAAVIGADVPVGLTCSPLTAIGLGSNSWYVL